MPLDEQHAGAALLKKPGISYLIAARMPCASAVRNLRSNKYCRDHTIGKSQPGPGKGHRNIVWRILVNVLPEFIAKRLDKKHPYQ